MWGEEDVQAQLEGCKRNKSVYERLAKRMLPEFSRSGTQCREKMKKLRNEYKKIKDSNGKTGRERKSMKFFEQLNDILGTRPATRPALLIDSGTPAVQGAVTEVEPAEGQTAEADAAAKIADQADQSKGNSTSSTRAETGSKQTNGKPKRAREELFERAIDTAMKKIAEAN